MWNSVVLDGKLILAPLNPKRLFKKETEQKHTSIKNNITEILLEGTLNIN